MTLEDMYHQQVLQDSYERDVRTANQARAYPPQTPYNTGSQLPFLHIAPRFYDPNQARYPDRENQNYYPRQ